MIDTARRKKLALHLRHLSVGLTTNDEFEEAVTESITHGWLPEQYYRSKQVKNDDPIIQPMLDLCWGLYDDTRQHRLTKSDKLTKEALRIIARSILFLHSDRDYEWSYFDTNNPLLKFSLKDLILTILTLGHHYIKKRKAHLISYYQWQQQGEYDVWPFFRKIDYQNQLGFQPFLKRHEPTQTALAATINNGSKPSA
jgi:hypothetical protein